MNQQCVPVKTRECIFPEDHTTLEYKYALSLQQELTSHYLFEEPNEKVKTITFADTVPTHTHYKLVLYVKHKELLF